MTGRHQFYQVFVAGVVLGQKHEMIVTPFAVTAGPFIVHIFGDIYFTADDRFDTGFFTFLIELNGAIKRTVVGDGASIHAQFPDPRDQFINFR